MGWRAWWGFWFGGLCAVPYTPPPVVPVVRVVTRVTLGLSVR